jgi:hypothetical protein
MAKTEQTIALNSKQRTFGNSQVRYPAYIAAWGTGKTMTAIMKGMLLSETFPNNLGLFVRKNFTDLRDSTIKDFEDYTGLTVNKANKEITLANGSVIMFRHGDELSTLQNINLGWFVMEQAEEFDTAEQFDMLRGRLRRAVGVRQGMVIGNTAGHNWIWDRWRNKKLPEYELTESDTFENRENLPADFIKDLERLRTENPRKFNRYVMNSWEDYDLEGAFYAALMSDALKQNRVGLQTLYTPDQPVYTFWDLGVRASDTTAIWCVQFIGSEIHLVDYYENYGEGMEHYVLWLNKKPYVYGADYLPHDAKNRQQSMTIETRLEILRSLRKNPVLITEDHSIEDRIQVVRDIIHKCRFNQNCRVGVECLNHYRKKKNEILSTEARPVFSAEPLHDWASNGADAFGYMAIAYKYMSITGQRIGKTSLTLPGIGTSSAYDNNILGRGFRKTA